MIRVPFTRASSKSAPPQRRSWWRLCILGLALNGAGLLIALSSYSFRPLSPADLEHGLGYSPAVWCGIVGIGILLTGAGFNYYALFLRRRYAKRARFGQCEACGYDLRASKARCSECGMPISAVTS